jgi:hypothetical protein
MDIIYILYSEIYYEPLYKTYVNILTLNKEPHGELKKYTKHIRLLSPSTKEEVINSAYCTYALSTSLISTSLISTSLINTRTLSNFMTLEQLDEFTEFIINNNYIINNTLTQHYKEFFYNTRKKLIYVFMLKI